mgnify:CR=1|jgi:hypothetical protein
MNPDRAQLSDLFRERWPKQPSKQLEARAAVLVLLRAAAPAYQHKATREALDVLREVYDINPSEILESER